MLYLQGNYVAVGTNKGYVQIWDVAATKRITSFSGHNARVGALAWNADLLSSGSRDRMIIQRDIRANAAADSVKKLSGHRQEVRQRLSSYCLHLILLSCLLILKFI